MHLTMFLVSVVAPLEHEIYLELSFENIVEGIKYNYGFNIRQLRSHPHRFASKSLSVVTPEMEI